MRRLSLNARLMQDAEVTGEIHAALFEITHPDLPAPIRLSTDNTERLTSDPLVYGTRSNWRGADPVSDPYLWVIASALLPSDLEDTPSTASIILENLDGDMLKALRSFTDPATINMADVLASSPNDIEAEWHGLLLQSVSADAGQITLSLSREEIEQEYFPSPRMSRSRFPGLHR